MRPASSWGLTFELRRVRSFKLRLYFNNWSWLTRLFAYIQIGYYILNMTVNDPAYANRSGSCLGPDR